MWCTCSVVVVAVVVDVVVVHFLDICTSKSGPNPSVFFTWKRASCHNGVQFIISHLARWLRARHFSEVTFRPSRATVNRDFPTFSRTCIFSLLTLSLLWSSHFFSISPYCRKFDFQTSFDNGMEVLSHFSALERKRSQCGELAETETEVKRSEKIESNEKISEIRGRKMQVIQVQDQEPHTKLWRPVISDLNGLSRFHSRSLHWFGQPCSTYGWINRGIFGRGDAIVYSRWLTRWFQSRPLWTWDPMHVVVLDKIWYPLYSD